MREADVWIFDMDGTVLDTITDLTASLNFALRSTGYRGEFPEETVKAFFGSGAAVAVTRALAMEAGTDFSALETVGTAEDTVSAGIDPEEVKRVLAVFKPHYEAHCGDHTAAYAGIPGVLRQLRERGKKTAVVSNKPDPAVQELARDLFPGMFDFVLGEKAGMPRKPAPDMVLAAMEALGGSRETSVCVGDSEIDLQTAENAGIPCICVLWGFRTKEFLVRRGAEILAASAEEIPDAGLI